MKNLCWVLLIFGFSNIALAGEASKAISKEMSEWTVLKNRGDYSHFGVLTTGAFNGKWEHFFIQYHGYQHTSRVPGLFLNQSETVGIRFNYFPSSAAPSFATTDYRTISTGASFDPARYPDTPWVSSGPFNRDQIAHPVVTGGECRGGAAGYFRERVNGVLEEHILATTVCSDYVNPWGALLSEVGSIAPNGLISFKGRQRANGDLLSVVDSKGKPIPAIMNMVNRKDHGSLFMTYGKIKQARDGSLFMSALIGALNFMLTSHDYGRTWVPKLIACGIDPARISDSNNPDTIKAAYASQLRVCTKFAVALGQTPTVVEIPQDLSLLPPVVQGDDYPIVASDLSELALERLDDDSFIALARLNGALMDNGESVAALLTLTSKDGKSWRSRGKLPFSDYGNVSPLIVSARGIDPKTGAKKKFLIATVSRRDGAPRNGELQAFVRTASVRDDSTPVEWSKPIDLAHNIQREEKPVPCIRDEFRIKGSRFGYQDEWFHPANGKGYIIMQHELDDCTVVTRIRPLSVSEILNTVGVIP